MALRYATQVVLSATGALARRQANPGTELGQQTPNTIDASGSFALEALAQVVHTQDTLLSRRLHRDEAHLRARGGLTDRGSVIGVVLATLALHPVWLNQLGRHDSGHQPQALKLACPMVRTATRLHGYHAAPWELGSPGNELITGQCPTGHDFTGRIDRVNPNDPLGQVDTDSYNLTHGKPLFGWLLIDYINVNLRIRQLLTKFG